MVKKIVGLICAVLMIAGVALASEGYDLDGAQKQVGVNFLGTGIVIGPIEYGTYDYYHYGYGYYDYYYGYNTTTENSTSFYFGGFKADVVAIQAIAQIQDNLPCGVNKMSQSFENNLLLKSNGLTIKMSQEGHQTMKANSNYYQVR
jgi:hypothetical protein